MTTLFYHTKDFEPTYGSFEAIGLDLRLDLGAPDAPPVPIHPRGMRRMPTGLVVAIPAGHYGRIAPRSGLAVKHGIDVLAGVIDSDYRGEIQVILINHSDQTVHFRHGDRIAQLILEKATRPKLVAVDRIEDLGNTERGAGGFGSTGT